MIANPHTKTLIIVDDNPADSLFAMQIIKRYRSEYEVVFMDEGIALLDYFNNGLHVRPAAIFLDMQMPGLNGMDVLRKLKKTDQVMDIPVIMLTSSRFELDITESYRLGAAGYIVKPLDQQKFLDVLDNLPVVIR